jgi:ribosomal-protein-alanine N-acetyltransferase
MNIRLINKNDAELLSNYYQKNLDFFRPWEPNKSDDFHHLKQWQQRIVELVENQRNTKAVYVIALDENNENILAHCNLSQIFYGAFCACYMGYAVSKEYQGSGVMRKTCQFAIKYAFDELRLHRIMANYMPRNHRSEALLKKLGFVKEGFAKDYLEINGHWQDHVLTSLTNKNFIRFS